jgi:hypothetical protein
MRNVERKGAGQALHPFIRVFRTGLAAAQGLVDYKKEMVRPFIDRAGALDRSVGCFFCCDAASSDAATAAAERSVPPPTRCATPSFKKDPPPHPTPPHPTPPHPTPPHPTPPHPTPQGAAYYCPFMNRKAVVQNVMDRSRAEAEEMVSDFVEKTRRWASLRLPLFNRWLLGWVPLVCGLGAL